VPVRLIVWALTLLAIETEAVRVPLADGLKVTLMVQLAPAATELPQVLLWAKSLALTPETAMLEMFSVALPGLLRVAVCAALALPRDWLPKERLEGETLISAAVPVPERVTDSGVLEALLLMVRVEAKVAPKMMRIG